MKPFEPCNHERIRIFWCMILMDSWSSALATRGYILGEICYIWSSKMPMLETDLTLVTSNLVPTHWSPPMLALSPT